mmetsp:Transcript_25362/g.31754  ORF Transcript_25362/g.31754 Transcript_25362/m.31754 type:complete len:150 (+) Transcript_25362:585-1034(+)
MLTGEPAFPMRVSEDEQNERIKKCQFTFPDEVPLDGSSSGSGMLGSQLDLTYSEVSDNVELSQHKKRKSSPRSKVAKLSDPAKDLIRGLIVANGKKRLSIHKIKKHEFFRPIVWSDIEKVKIKMPKVSQREPKSGMFEDVEYDSCDEDF